MYLLTIFRYFLFFNGDIQVFLLSLILQDHTVKVTTPNSMLPPMQAPPQSTYPPPQSTYPPPQSFFNANLPHQSHQQHASSSSQQQQTIHASLQQQHHQNQPRLASQQQPMQTNRQYHQQPTFTPQPFAPPPQNQHQPMMQQQQPVKNYQHQSAPSHPPPQQQQPPPMQPPKQAAPIAAPKKQQVEFNHAISYVNKIKTRFAEEPEKYKQFLEILQTYKQSKPIKEVYKEVSELFKGSPDLLDEFKQFLPDLSAKREGIYTMFLIVDTTTRTGGKRTAPPMQDERPAKKRVKTAQGTGGAAMEELEFFEKVKRTINYKPTYTEFLKVLNLFSQDIIGARTLVERVAPFLERTPDLFEWFKRFVKYEVGGDIVVNEVGERPGLDLDSYKRCGNSYRLLPKNV
jgi:paired amphipathic helix protein Sin3a